MELTRLEMTNWLCHNHKVIDFAPLTIIAGPNSSGKSPIADAVAFALAGELRRVSLAGDRVQLLTEGTKKGSVSLRSGTWSTTRDIETGKHKAEGTPPITEKTVRDALTYVLEVDRFATATSDERGIVLRRVMGVDLSGDKLKAEMIARGHDKNKVECLDPAKTLDDWVSLAHRTATEFRGAWKAVTGETYGSVKAQTWTAPSAGQAVSDVQMTALTTQVTTMDVEQGDLQRRLGEIAANERRGTTQAQQLVKLKADAAKLATAQAHFSAMGGERVVHQTRVDRAAAAVAALVRPSSAVTAPATLSCPGCGVNLVLVEGELVHAEDIAPAFYDTPDHIKATEDALTEARAGLEQAEARKALAQQEVEQALAAKKAIELFMPGDVPGAGDSPDRKEDLERHLADVQNRLGQARQAERNAQEGNAAVRRASQKTREASGHHRSVTDWTGIAAALSPEGIPGELLAKALKPFNDTLRDISTTVGWKLVTIGPAMDISADGRRYDLLGESERWRSDVMMAIALAIHSDLKFVLIDRFDVLEPAARGKAMGLFLAMTKAGMMDTIVVMATLKAAPPAPPGAVVHWLGETEQKKAAA